MLTEGRKPLPIGTVRIRNGYEYVKTAKGWEYQPKGSKAKTPKDKPPIEGKFLKYEEFITYREKHEYNLSTKEQYAAHEYSEDAYQNINSSLRKGYDLIYTDEDIVEKLDTAIAKNSFDVDLKVRRFAGPTAAKKLGSLSAGDTFVDKAFVSTTALEDHDHAKNKLELASVDAVSIVITIPKGHPALVLPSMSPGEREVILGRDTKFVVKSVTKGRKLQLELEVVADE